MQESVEKYASQGVVPGFRELLKHGARASDDGLLTEAPPNTGSGWFTLATGAWAGVHGSTNNTFHKNGDPSTATPRPRRSCSTSRFPRPAMRSARRTSSKCSAPGSPCRSSGRSATRRLEPVDALYFAMATLTTTSVADPDLVLQDGWLKIFTILYQLIGIGILVEILRRLGSAFVQVRKAEG